jgi:hypothetical protein
MAVRLHTLAYHPGQVQEWPQYQKSHRKNKKKIRNCEVVHRLGRVRFLQGPFQLIILLPFDAIQKTQRRKTEK